jgi:photosystem II stability/assembly factor-like uncharacterized protein
MKNWANPYMLYGVVWAGNQLVGVGDGGTIVTSSDDSTWTIRATDTVHHFTLWNVAWTGSRIVAVGDSGTILTSADGIAWTSRLSRKSYRLCGVTWTGSQLVAVGDIGAILTSPDGNVWTYRSSGISQLIESVLWDGMQCVAVADPNYILTSPDGITWTSQTINTQSNTMGRIAWTGGQYVAVGRYGAILTSPRGPVSVVNGSGSGKKSVDKKDVIVSSRDSYKHLTLPAFMEGMPVSWTIYSLSGEKLQSGNQTIPSAGLDLSRSAFARGVYMLETRRPGAVYTSKFWIN